MDKWFSDVTESRQLPSGYASTLADKGFVIIPGPVPQAELPGLATAYDGAIAAAEGTSDHKVGSTSTRVFDLVNRGAAFDSVYTHPPLMEAVDSIMRRPFRLSMLLARTLHPGSVAQELHVDLKRDDPARPMVGFILMIDAFRHDNGATRIVPCSHRWRETPNAVMSDTRAPYAGEVLACGPAGALLIFDASMWHGHTANTSGAARRSVQGYFIPREASSEFDLRCRMRPDTLARIGPVARYVLAMDGCGEAWQSREATLIAARGTQH